MNSVILDTDIGYDPDDMIALLLLLKSPEASLDLIITGDEIGRRRARFARQVLDLADRADIPVVAGRDVGNRNFVVNDLLDGRYEISKDYRKAMLEVLDKSEQVTYIGIDGFSNLARFIGRHPERIEQLTVYQMGGALDYERKPGWIEHNVKIDVPSARRIFTSDVDLSLVLSQTTFRPDYEVNDTHPIYHQLKESENRAYRLLADHIDRFHGVKGYWTRMHDPLTVSAALGYDFVDFTPTRVVMQPSGALKTDAYGKHIRASQASRPRAFMSFLEERLFS